MSGEVRRGQARSGEVTHVPLHDVAVVVADVSGQTEVTDLRHAAVGQQDVPRCYVSVDTLTDRQVGRETDGLRPADSGPLGGHVLIRGLCLHFLHAEK
ncbi:hypothetical protein EYF80_032933 [Liparis tanakae]|uniref:Uncharacterized protein n=1 Tax=Liparis tanakae TaxID=230148 RepID=A0A4Z2GTB1_9TELE|nr:hypothetical protein EYF80_032933 [Liparis tanakae]